MERFQIVILITLKWLALAMGVLDGIETLNAVKYHTPIFPALELTAIWAALVVCLSVAARKLDTPEKEQPK